MKRLVSFFLVFMLVPAIAFCSTTKVLEQDKTLHPQGWPFGTLMFKGGTQVTLNENGEVITGVMKYNEPLITPGSISDIRTAPFHDEELYRINFRGDSYPITFNEKGEVISGTLCEFNSVRLTNNAGKYIDFKKSTVITFNSDGGVKQGTLDNTYEIRPAGWRKFLPVDDNAGFIKFQKGTEVTFGSGAQVIKGTIANDLRINGITYPAGTTLQFSESDYPQRI